jgi:hypothetical protein
MRLTLVSLIAVASSTLAAPHPQHKEPSSAQSLADLIAGAVTFPTQFLSGNAKGVKQSIDLMNDGAASFSPNILREFAKLGLNPPKGQQPR